LYVVQKSPNLFLYEPKKLCKLQKTNTDYELYTTQTPFYHLSEISPTFLQITVGNIAGYFPYEFTLLHYISILNKTIFLDSILAKLESNIT